MVAINLFQFHSCNNCNYGVLVIMLDFGKELMLNYVVSVNENDLSTGRRKKGVWKCAVVTLRSYFNLTWPDLMCSLL